MKREAEKRGITLEEYLLELISYNLNPRDRAVEYVKVSEELLEQCESKLEKNNVRQATEKAWGP